MPQPNAALPMVRTAMALESAAYDESSDHGGGGGGGGRDKWEQVGAAWTAQMPMYPAHVQVPAQRQHRETPQARHLIQTPLWHPHE